MTVGTEERCEARAASCEKVAGQDGAPVEMRRRFARKASSFRIMAKLAALDEAKRIEDEDLASKKTSALAEIARPDAAFGSRMR